jgi:hypothetical protein
LAYEQKDNSGSLFINDKREKDTHANARGSALIGGVAYWVDAWTKTTGEGKKWQSLSFKRKDAPLPKEATESPRAAKNSSGMDDDIPF